ncbi:beta-hexosaminidase [Pseudohyphozyma bogoriensis]|nr:beta-hexosaminidase [Pseudohyphozyma bogoriensis]
MHYITTDMHSRLIVGRGETDRPSLQNAASLQELQLDVVGTHSLASLVNEVQKPVSEWEESYKLTIPGRGSDQSAPTPDIQATLEANSTVGLLRGLQTFNQLVYSLDDVEEAPTRYMLDTPLSIADEPSFPYRAFMIDTSRNFYSVSTIEKTLQTMSWAKLNVLHWHVVDSQSWPLEVPTYPNLTASAYSPTSIYTVSDVAHLQSFAASLGITIMLEIDIPGHTWAVGEAFPEFMECVAKEDWWNWAAGPPSGQLKLGDRRVREFVEGLMKDVAGRMTGSLVSTGGDEVNLNCYVDGTVTNSTLRARRMTVDDGVSELVGGAHDALRSEGKVPVVWEEMVLGHDINLANDTVVLVWISSANVRSVVDKGFQVIHAASDYFYLDCGGGGWLGDYNSNSWCDPFKTWQQVYSFDPYNNITEAQRPLILGGQSLLWSEQASPENLESLAWPRAAAAAEVFWTGATLSDGRPRNADEALPRMHDWRYRACNYKAKAPHPVDPTFVVQ